MKAERILITGAGSGLGKLTALTLAKLGHSVIATTETQSHADMLRKDAVAPMIRVILGQTKKYRNIIPRRLIPVILSMEKYEWIRKTNWFLGKRHIMAKKSMNMEPATRK